MADVHDRLTRSYNMSQIKGKDTKPELIVRKFLHMNGLRYSLHSKGIPGKPDIVLRKYKAVVDVRGCFWHGHTNCKYGDHVKSESIQITDRIRSAVERDQRNMKAWKRLGWRVFVVWDRCQLEDKKNSSTRRDKVLRKLLNDIKQI